MAKECGGWTWLEPAGAASVTKSRGLAGDFSLRLPTYAAAPGGLKQNKKSRRS